MRFVYLLCLLLLVVRDIPVQAQPGADSSGVVVFADPRLAILLRKRESPSGHMPHGIIRSGRGFRVQIYSGPDRVKANQVKIDFLRRYPGVKTYLSYISPTFRLKVGDFQSRGEAQKLWLQVKGLYNPSMIVPDIIVINTLRND